MPPSPVSKYEIILAADPKSRVFVEFARALIEAGDCGRAAQVCRQGLQHHPGSVQGRVLLGRALLGAGDERAAVKELEAAAAIEPANPYGWNLAAEVLVEKGLHGRAVRILEKAVELQPSNEQLAGWLERARHDAAALPPEPAPAEGGPADGGAPPADGAPSAGGPAPEDGTPAKPPSGETAAGAPAAAVPPLPPRRPAPPPLKRQAPGPRNPLAALQHLPGEPSAPPAPQLAATRADPREAARIASEYERDLRQKMLAAEKEPPPGFLRRHWLPLVLAFVVVVGGGGGALVYRGVRSANRAAEVKDYVEAARKGLARDTAGALREAARVLASARELDPQDAQAVALSAEVEALLAADFGDEEARDQARALAASPLAGEGAVAARYLLASNPAELRAASEPLRNQPIGVGPLLQDLTARALLARGEAQAALSRLELAAKGSPPSLRALADLGDYYRERGDLDQALGYYRAALGAHPTHPRSAIGAAEARLALGRDLAESLATFKAVEADEASPPPLADRMRFELAYARLLGASGQRAAAGERLARAAERLGARAELPATAAEIQMAAGDFAKAEAEARRATRLAPREAAWRVLLARAQAGQGRYRELLRESDGFESRDLRLWRGVARYELRDYRGARAELEKTRRESRMPAEAAAYYALADFGLGRQKEARSVLEKLVLLPRPPALAFVASGHLAAARGDLAEAERDYRSAVERDPSNVEGHCALGRLLLSRGDAKAARPLLERAVELNASHAEARVALGEALLALREPGQAREAFGAVLSDDPRHAGALRGLSAADLASGNLTEARAAADRAVVTDGKNPASWLAAGRAAQAQGDGAAARHAFGKVLQLRAKGEVAAEAHRRLAESRRLK